MKTLTIKWLILSIIYLSIKISNANKEPYKFEKPLSVNEFFHRSGQVEDGKLSSHFGNILKTTFVAHFIVSGALFTLTHSLCAQLELT